MINVLMSKIHVFNKISLNANGLVFNDILRWLNDIIRKCTVSTL